MAKARPVVVPKRIVLACLLGLVLCPTPRLLAQQKSADAWEVLAGCHLITNANAIVDGDSFHVAHKEREYVFRLYFVDAPESDATLTERAQDQAAYFGISPNDISRAGTAASQFTRATLSDADITVITRWRNAMGRSTLARFYAVVLVNGKNLAEELVAHGHARIYGLRANWPDGPRSTTFINKLKNLELIAREKKRGIWDETKFPRQVGSAAVSVAPTNTPIAASLVDINNATYEELQKLPGIGPKLAERIMAHRPYKITDDLGKVPGIGVVMLKRLKPLIRAEPAAP
ncbi:MAG: helix-hairpin-helix domain-containing protein [Verrucomicrobia bacterium]|nr:helix-hairpin-helix domain-containing protein [Verrucomicrobiota bacterium]